MNLEKLYKMQEELDNHIWEKHETLDKMSKEELLDSTILALLVEMGELANTTRCFKHWSTKEMMDKEIVLDELADVIHFYLSIGNQINYRYKREDNFTEKEIKEMSLERKMTEIFKILYSVSSVIYMEIYDYYWIGQWLEILICKLDFSNQEVERAYLKKHKENYRRQEEGY